MQEPPTTMDGDTDGKIGIIEIDGLKDVKGVLVEDEAETALTTPGPSATQTSPGRPSTKPFW